jgi:2-amino-4-hydroxy-6-hydroxymethyldihydropteridine diphosphokinase
VLIFTAFANIAATMDINTTHRPYKSEQLVLLLGSNMGDKLGNLVNAQRALERVFGKCLFESSVYDTLPWGMAEQENFYNQALVFEVDMRPTWILDQVLHIELEMGRKRYEKWGPRLIDIDVIFFGDLVFEGDHLRIPHPLMHERSFVLEPLNEIIPDFEHPIFSKKVRQLLVDLKNKQAKQKR